MAIIDILIAVDAEKVIQSLGKNNGQQIGKYKQFGDAELAAQCIFMVAPWANAVNNEGQWDPHNTANKGDKIRWRMTSMSMGHSLQCFISHISVKSGAQYITQPKPTCETVDIPQIDSSAPGLNKTICRPLEDYYWESMVLEKNTVTYYISFVICGEGCSDGGNSCGCCNCCGGYQWDPWIN